MTKITPQEFFIFNAAILAILHPHDRTISHHTINEKFESISQYQRRQQLKSGGSNKLLLQTAVLRMKHRHQKNCKNCTSLIFRPILKFKWRSNQGPHSKLIRCS
jgi:hypothetical protein